MKNKAFGEVLFDTGWETSTEIVLWEKSYTIKVRANAYYEEDGITSEQEASYSLFTSTKVETIMKVEKMISEYCENCDSEYLKSRFIPQTLVFWDNGGFALMLSDADDIDNGIAVSISPKEEVMSQDEYLTYNY